ncbi:MAG: sigma 54-interacting transcriptional regulator [Firmicutes bacterium]|nr:sigma 54-interacting transcriptional regulator [Bacillota bacterium]
MIKIPSDRVPLNSGKPDSSTDNLWIDSVLDNPFEGVLAIDETGAIVFVNSFFLKLLGKPAKKVFNQKIWEVIPNCSLYDTVTQGYSQWGETLKLNGRDLLVARFPLKREGRVVGAMVKTLFPDMAIARGIANKVTHPVKQNNYGPCRPLFTCLDIIGESPPMLLAKKLARRASRTDSTVLITGESGTGKEVFAQAIHNRSIRREGPFIRVNCAAVPESLLESELFGFVDGAFTGAKRGGKPGKFEAADGGAIFLDEIGDMPLTMQAKLLRVLQEKEVERLGATQPMKLDVRVIAATNQDLVGLVKERRFREDLYYRFKVLEIHLPPLRERTEDIPSLIESIIGRINLRLGTDAKGVTSNTLESINQYSWPGNIRELENLLEQAINWSEDPYLDLSRVLSIPAKKGAVPRIPGTRHCAADRMNYHDLLEETEKNLIIDALNQSNGNKAKAARILNIQRSVLYKKLERLKLEGMNRRV